MNTANKGIRTEKGYYKPKYENLGKTELFRCPKEFISTFNEILIILNDWSNVEVDPLETLAEILVFLKNISKVENHKDLLDQFVMLYKEKNNKEMLDEFIKIYSE